MKYELDLFVASLHKDAQPAAWRSLEPLTLEVQFVDLCTHINNTRELLRHWLTNGKINKLSILVPIAQKDITRGLDMLEQLITVNNGTTTAHKNETVDEYYHRLHYMLRRLLEYVFIDFGDYYDTHQKIPNFVMRKKTFKVTNFKRKLEKAFLQPGISDATATLLQSPVEHFLDPSRKTSHYQLVYLRMYRKRYYEDNFSKIKTNWDAMLLIVSLRLNSYAGVQCCLGIIGECLALQETGKEYELLNEMTHEINCIRMANIDRYDTDLPEIQTHLLDHLANWMMMFAFQKNEEENVSPADFCAEKIKLSFSVDELGLLLYLMNESGMILNKNFLNVVRAATQSFSTKAKADVAYESLRSKSYKPDPGAAGKLQEKLMVLFNKAREH